MSISFVDTGNPWKANRNILIETVAGIVWHRFRVKNFGSSQIKIGTKIISAGSGLIEIHELAAHISWLDVQERRFERRLELLRGKIVHFRGARVGKHFGLGRGVRLLYPGCFTAGDDVTIEDYSYLNCLSERGVLIGSHTSIDRNLWLTCGGTTESHSHGYCRIGEHSYIGCNAVLGAGGGIEIGDHVLIGQSVNIHAESHAFDDLSRPIAEQSIHYQGVKIENNVWIGSKVTILDGVMIGEGAVIGAGAVVTQSIPPLAIAMGVPARVIRFRNPSQK